MYDLCRRHDIPHRNTKKWVIAQDDAQMAAISKVHEFAKSMDVPTRFLPRDEIQEREPDVQALGGVLESSSTGIVDSHALMAYLEGDFQERAGEEVFHTSVTRIEALGHGKNGWRIYTKPTASLNDSFTDEDVIEVDTLINSAGLGAITVNNLIFPKDDPRHRTPYFAKGTYFSYAASHPKPTILLYPAPVPGLGGLGTHLTLDMAGRVRFGPDVEWVDDPSDLAPRPARLKEAILMIKTYLPGVDESAIDLDYCGIRPKLAPGGGGTSSTGSQDFYIKQEEGYSGFVNLLGIESPGLTSCLAIGEMVKGMLYGDRGR